MNSLIEKTHEKLVWIVALIIAVSIAAGCQSEVVVENTTWTPVIQEIDGFDMVKVPSGCFMMGDPALDRAQPVHDVCITESYWIDLTEVSNGQFDSYGGQAAHAPAFPGQDISAEELPRTSVTWEEAEAFCQLRGGRLPTEAEWEYAARGPDTWSYPWGDLFDPRKLNFCDQKCPYGRAETIQDNTADDGYAVAAPVDSFPEGASWVGALNMSGNVAEWVQDFFDPTYYENSPRDNPTGPENGQTRVVKSSPWTWWKEPESFSQSANRWNFIPDATGKEFSGSTGFRCVQADS